MILGSHSAKRPRQYSRAWGMWKISSCRSIEICSIRRLDPGVSQTQQRAIVSRCS